MNGSGSEIPTEEEKLVAELDLLGIRYLSRQTHYRSDRIRSPEVAGSNWPTAVAQP